MKYQHDNVINGQKYIEKQEKIVQNRRKTKKDRRKSYVLIVKTMI